MICPIMSNAAGAPPTKIECSENCAWYMEQFKSCAMVELVNRADAFEVSAAMNEVSSEIKELQNGFSGIIQTMYDR